jgi:hypothetical protein
MERARHGLNQEFHTEAFLVSLWAEFNERFGKEEECVEEVYRLAIAEGILYCRNCGSRRFRRKYGERVMSCMKCKNDIWLTAGTLLHNARKIKPWLGAMWLLGHGAFLSSAGFERLASIAQSSALNILRKIRTVMTSSMDERSEEFLSSQFISLFCKRSRETPARRHPRAEEEISEEEGEGEAAEPLSANDYSQSSHRRESPPPSTNGATAFPQSMTDGTYQTEADVRDFGHLSNISMLEGAEIDVYRLLSQDPRHIDTLLKQSMMPLNELASTLVGRQEC